MSQDRIAQRGVGQPRDDCNLDGGHDLGRPDAEGSKPEDAIAVSQLSPLSWMFLPCHDI
jgi:hypothetical protein